MVAASVRIPTGSRDGIAVAWIRLSVQQQDLVSDAIDRGFTRVELIGSSD